MRMIAGWVVVLLGLGGSALALAGTAEHVTLSYGAPKEQVPVTILKPQGYDKAHRYPVIFTLPPGPGNAQMVAVNLKAYWEQEGLRRGYLIVTPQILGLKLRRAAPALVKAVFAWMDRNLAYDKTRVVLTGASNGGLGAFYTILAQPERFSALIAMPGGYRGRVQSLAKLKDKPVWLMVGGKDAQWKRLAEATQKALNQAGARTRLDVLPGQGHMLRVSPKKLFDWIEAQGKAKRKK